MNALFNKIFRPYLSQYFKNIEHLDLSIKDSKIKIDSLVPYYEMISNLLNLDKLNLKIESGILKNIVIEFPINVLKNNIRISIKSIDFYISELDLVDISKDQVNHKKNFCKNIVENSNFDLKSSSSPRSASSNNSINNNEESFFFKAKDDILGNFIIKIENISLYFFNSNNIIKFELSNLIFSPCDIENEDFEFSETFIRGVKAPNLKYRKTLIIDRFKASLQQQLIDEAKINNLNSNKAENKINSYFIKNLKIIANFFYHNKEKSLIDFDNNLSGDHINQSVNTIQNFTNSHNIDSEDSLINTKILFDNFLFDYDINDSRLLLDSLTRIFNKIRINNNVNNENSESINMMESKDSDFNKFFFSGVSYLDLLRNQFNNTIESYKFGYYNVNIFFNNTNINFYYNNCNNILFCLILNKLNLKLNNFNKGIDIFPILENINKENYEKNFILIRNNLDKINFDFNFDKIFIIIPVIENQKEDFYSNLDKTILNDTINNFDNSKQTLTKKEISNSNIKIVVKGDYYNFINSKNQNYKYEDLKNSLLKSIKLSMKIIDSKGKKKIVDNITIILKIFNNIYLTNLKENEDLYVIKRNQFHFISDENDCSIKNNFEHIKDIYILLIDQITKLDFNNIFIKFDYSSLFAIISTFYYLSLKIKNLFRGDNQILDNKNITEEKIKTEIHEDLNKNISKNVNCFDYYTNLLPYIESLREKFLSNINTDFKIKMKINNLSFEIGEFFEANEKTMFLNYLKVEINNFKLYINKQNEFDIIFNKNSNITDFKKVKKIHKNNQNNQIYRFKFSIRVWINNFFSQSKIELFENIQIKLKKMIFSKFYFLFDKTTKYFRKIVKSFNLKKNSNKSQTEIFTDSDFFNIEKNNIDVNNLKVDLLYLYDEKIKTYLDEFLILKDKEYSKENSSMQQIDYIFCNSDAVFYNANFSDLKFNFNAYAFNFIYSLTYILTKEFNSIAKNMNYYNSIADIKNQISRIIKTNSKRNNIDEDNKNDNSNINISNSNLNLSFNTQRDSLNSSISNTIPNLKSFPHINSGLSFYSRNSSNNFDSNIFNSKKDFSNAFISTLFNCTGYILEINTLYNNINQLLRPNEKIFLLHRYFKINITINDSLYTKTLDLLQVYISLCGEEAIIMSAENTKNRDHIKIDYLKIDMIEKENNTKKYFNLFYKYDSKAKNKIDFYIFDNVLIINNFPNLTSDSILHYIVDKADEISSLGQFNSENYNLSFSLIPSMKNRFNLNDDENPAPILAFLSDNFLLKNYLLNEIELEINYKDKSEVINFSSKDENSLMILKDDLISVYLILKIPTRFHLKNMIDNSSNKIFCYKSDDIKSIFTGDRYGSFMVKVFYKNTLNALNIEKENSIILNNIAINNHVINSTNQSTNTSRFLLVNLILEEFLKSHLFYNEEIGNFSTTNNISSLNCKKSSKNYLFNENKIFGSPFKIIKILPDLEIKKFTDENLFDFFFITNDICDKFLNDDIIYEKNNVQIKKNDDMDLNSNFNIEFNEFNYELHNNLYQIVDSHSSYILGKSIENSNNVKYNLKKIRIGIRFKDDSLDNSEIKKIYENYREKFHERANIQNNMVDHKEVLLQYNNSQIIRENECDEISNLSNEPNLSCFTFKEFCEKLNLKFFDRYFFSRTINLDYLNNGDSSVQNIKDYVFSIKLFDDFVVFFRIKFKRFYNYMWSLNLSSFINFSIKNSTAIKNLRIFSQETIEVLTEKSKFIHEKNSEEKLLKSFEQFENIHKEDKLIQLENSSHNALKEKELKMDIEEFLKEQKKSIKLDFLNKSSNICFENISNYLKIESYSLDFLLFNFLYKDKINKLHIPFDNIFRISKSKLDKNIIIDLQDLHSFINLIKTLKTNFTLTIILNNSKNIEMTDMLNLNGFKELICDFNLESLFLNENYQVNSIAHLDKNFDKITNNNFSQNLQVHNKIFNCRLIYSPYIITEFYAERYIKKKNFYLLFQNHTEYEIKISSKFVKEDEKIMDCKANSHNEFVLFSNINSLAVIFDLKSIVKNRDDTNFFNDKSEGVFLKTSNYGYESLSIYLMQCGGEDILFKNELNKLNQIILRELGLNFYFQINFDINVNYYFVKIIQHCILEKNKIFNEYDKYTDLSENNIKIKRDNEDQYSIQTPKKKFQMIFKEGAILDKKNIFTFNISNIIFKLNYFPVAELSLYSKHIEYTKNNFIPEFCESSLRNSYNFQAYYQKNNKIILKIDKIFGNINFNNIRRYNVLISKLCNSTNQLSQAYINESFYKEETIINFSITKSKLERHQPISNNYPLINIASNNRIEKREITIFETNFLTDFKLEILEINSTLLKNISNFPSDFKEIIDLNKNIFYKLKMNFPFEVILRIDDSIFYIFSIFQSQLSKEYSKRYLNEKLKYDQNFRMKKMNKLKSNIIASELDSKFNYKLNLLKILSNNIFNYLILPKLRKNLIFLDISLNDFSIKLNIEYKKGVDFNVKNSIIKNKNKKIKDLICPSELIFEEIKNSFFENFFTNAYNLIKGTDLFGNFNQFKDEVQYGFQKFKENPLTTGIFSLFYSSIKGSINSVFGVGKSITNTISLNLVRQKNFNSEIYINFANYLKDFLINCPNLELIHVNISNLFEKILSKNQVVSIVNKIMSKKVFTDNKNNNINIIDNLTLNMGNNKAFTNNNLGNLTSKHPQSYSNIENSITDYIYLIKINKMSNEFLIENLYADFLNCFDDNEMYEVKYVFKCKESENLYFILIGKYFICKIQKNNNFTLIPYFNIKSFEINETTIFLNLESLNIIKIECENSEELNIIVKEIITKYKFKN